MREGGLAGSQPTRRGKYKPINTRLLGGPIAAMVLTQPPRPTLGVPNQNSDRRRHHRRNQRLGPLRGKMRWMRKDVADKSRKSTDRCLPGSRVQFPVHLREERNANRSSHSATYGREHRVV